MLYGLFGAFTVVAGFGVYFFHLNMRVISGNLTMLEEAADQQLTLDNDTLKKATHSGQYL